MDLQIFSSFELPWVILGDFNAILNCEEHRGGTFDNYRAKSKLFNEFINENQLFDLGFLGTPYTWCNNQLGLARRWARLDRVLANNEWFSKFNTYYNKHLPRTASDHSPLLLSAVHFSQHKHKVFRFDNYWFEYNTCHKHVGRAWTSRTSASPMQAVSHFIAKTKTYLCKWKSKDLTPFEENITKVEEEILQLEALESTLEYSDLTSIELRGLYNKHNSLLKQNTLKWAQRAKLLRIKHGDYNSTFFHKHARVRGHKNRVSALITDYGATLTDQISIGQAFSDFYTNLWTQSVISQLMNLS
ncbi:hypothetical protein J5N97_021683 [Dioscorea zingiberensis]|uniref:Endonuclease/exonuclease/phosphatase domain-containing protein n=1 Tax=Dioscorea zingiberensis TaxID=325984 RepID=A0A9D5H9V1_9LILI|nr:hypothetical protein J5N97_021683 [Dioscorea zingiberensis]